MVKHFIWRHLHVRAKSSTNAAHPSSLTFYKVPLLLALWTTLILHVIKHQSKKKDIMTTPRSLTGQK